MQKYNTIVARVYAALILGGVLVVSAGFVSAFTPGANGPKWTAPAAANGKKNPVDGNDAATQTGKKIYVKECASCHGKTGTGNGPKAGDLSKEPGNFAKPEFQSQTDGAIFWKITQGNKPMPSFKTVYNEEERWGIVNYLRTLGK